MFGDERANPKEIPKSVFGVASMSRPSGFRDNETGDARASGRPVMSLTGVPARPMVLLAGLWWL